MSPIPPSAPGTTEKIRVLILYPTATFIDSILNISRILLSRDSFEIIVYSHSWYPGFEDSIRKARSIGVNLLCFMNADRKSYTDPQLAIDALGLPARGRPRSVRTIESLRSVRRRTVAWAERIWGLLSARPDTALKQKNFRHALIRNASVMDRADFIIDTLDIDLLIVLSESASHQSHFFIESMKIVGRRSVFMPITISSHNELDGWLKTRKEGRLGSAADYVFAALFPRWLRRIHGEVHSRLPVAQALALEHDGLAPRRPWLSFTMASDLVACGSAFMRDRLVDLGARYRRRDLIVTGAAEDSGLDMESEQTGEVRTALIRDLNLDPAKPILLFSPPSDVSNQYPLNEHHSFSDMLEYWCNSFRCLNNISVIISPHPWYKNFDIPRRILTESGLPVVWKGAQSLMPGVDIFCTFGASSTPRLAAAAGLPVLNYFAFDAPYSASDAKSYFVGFDTMPVARSRAQWEALLARIDDPAWREDLCRRARARASYFGLGKDGFRARFVPIAEILARGRGPIAADEWRRIRLVLDGR